MHSGGLAVHAVDEAAQFGVRGIAIVDRRCTRLERDARQNDNQCVARGVKGHAIGWQAADGRRFYPRGERHESRNAVSLPVATCASCAPMNPDVGPRPALRYATIDAD